MIYHVCDVPGVGHSDHTCIWEDGDGFWANEIDDSTGVVYCYYLGPENDWRQLSPNELPDG